MYDDGDDDLRMTGREWLAARIVLIGGFIIAIAVAGYFTWSQHQQAVQDAAAQAAQQKAAEQAAAAPSQELAAARERTRMGLVVCIREIVNAETLGVVPKYAKLASGAPAATGVQGRYVCNAATDVAKYAVTADLICADMRKADCVKLYSVKSDDGTVLYQAKE
jgi:hypothetical protein